MPNPPDPAAHAAELRQRAEAQSEQAAEPSADQLATLSVAEIQRMLARTDGGDAGKAATRPAGRRR